MPDNEGETAVIGLLRKGIRGSSKIQKKKKSHQHGKAKKFQGKGRELPTEDALEY